MLVHFVFSVGMFTTADGCGRVCSVQSGAETGHEPLAKTMSYYKRSWVTGTPYSAIPSWGDLSHMPPSRRELVARPDLALAAMRRILGARRSAANKSAANKDTRAHQASRSIPLMYAGRVEAELAQEAEVRESQRLRREDRLASIRARHEKRHEAQRMLGIEPRRHLLGKHLKQRSQIQSAGSMTSSSSALALGLAVQVEEQQPGDHQATHGPPATPTSVSCGIRGPRPLSIVLPAAGGPLAQPGTPSSPSHSPSRSRMSRADSSPMLGMRAQQFALARHFPNADDHCDSSCITLRAKQCCCPRSNMLTTVVVCCVCPSRLSVRIAG